MKRLNSMVTIIVLMAGSFLFVSGEDTPQKTLFKNFEKAMKGVRFSGFFTVDGAKNPPSEEVYEIQSVQKFGEQNLAKQNFWPTNCFLAKTFFWHTTN